MPVKTFYLISAAILFAQHAGAENATSLSVDADPAVAVIKPLAEGRRLIRLPSLEFLLQIDATCGADAEITSISISIADTQRTLAGAMLSNDGTIAEKIRVPAQQLSPIAVDGFCPAGSAVADDTTMIVDALTASLSLRCLSDEGVTIAYAGHSLDVQMQCEAETDS